MRTAKKIAKNTGIMISSNVLTRLFDLLIVIYLARYLGTTGFGEYSFVFSFIFLLGILTDLSINKVVVRELSRDGSVVNKMVWNVFILRIFLTLISISLGIIIINLLEYSSQTRFLVYLALITLFFSSEVMTFNSIFQTNLRFKYIVSANIIGKVVQIGLVFLVIYLKLGIVYAVLSVLGGYVFNLLGIYAFSRQHIKARIGLDYELLKKVIKTAIPISLAGIFGMIAYRIDILMLSVIKNITEVGYYAPAYKLTESLNMIPIAFNMAIFPILSRYYKTSKDSLAKLYSSSFKYLLMAGLPIGVIVTLFSKEIILLIFGSEFLPSAKALSILVWFEVLLFIYYLFFNIAISIDKERIATITAAIMALGNISINLMLIPKYGFIGASISTVLTQVIGLTIYFRYIGINLIEKSLIWDTGRLIIANALLLSVMILLDFPSWLLSLLIAMPAYVFLLILTGSVTREEINLLGRMLRD